MRDVLTDLGIDVEAGGRMVEVWNKIDRLADDARLALVNSAERVALEERPILVSALTGEGTDDLLTVSSGASPPAGQRCMSTSHPKTERGSAGSIATRKC